MKAALSALALLALASCGVGTPVYAHQAMSGWTYPLACCSDRDCAVIDGRIVQETPAGYVVTVQPGGHPMWGPERPAPLESGLPTARYLRCAFLTAEASLPIGRTGSGTSPRCMQASAVLLM